MDKVSKIYGRTPPRKITTTKTLAKHKEPPAVSKYV